MASRPSFSLLDLMPAGRQNCRLKARFYREPIPTLIVSLFSHYKNPVHCFFKQTQFIYCNFYPITKKNVLDGEEGSPPSLLHKKAAIVHCGLNLVGEAAAIKIPTPGSN